MCEKQNQPMAWPKNPLSILLFNAVMSGQLVPYKNDSLGSAYTLEDIFREKLADTTVQDETDSLTGEPTGRQIKIANPFQPDLRIYKYRIVEDWIFDKKESRMFVRIIAIAPQFRPKFNGAETDQFDDLCVLRYHKKDGTNEKDIRDILINQEVFNRQNDAARLTYDDWFEQRLFSSYIVKEANMYDRYIREIAEFKDDGMAALLESDRIKNELFEREHDLWEY
jgi:gliding motility associated protien GldN